MKWLFAVTFCVFTVAAVAQEVVASNGAPSAREEVVAARVIEKSEVLPDAPSAVRKQPSFLAFRGPRDPSPLRTNREVFHNKILVTTQLVWLGAIVFDVEATHQGLAHHKCVEGNGSNPQPSRGGLYRSDLAEYSTRN